MRSALFLNFIVAVVGCSSPDRSATPTAKPATVAEKAPSAGAGSVASVSVPESLVKEFVRRDAAGERLRASPWFDSVVTEADEEGGYDSFTAIKQYQVGVAGDTVKVLVQYVILGAMQQVVDGEKTTGMRLIPNDSIANEVFSVVRQGGQWKIVTPEIDQHVLASAILTNTTLPVLSAEDRQRLAAATQ